MIGKGVYIWKPNKIGSPSDIARSLKNSGTDFVAIKIVNGTYIYPGLQPYITAIRKAGIAVGAWGYVYLRWSPLQEANRTADAVKLYNPDFYLIDAEAYAKWQFAPAWIYAKRLRSRLPYMPRGLNSYWYPPYHPSRPWKQLRSVCNFDAPQVYWRGYRPKDKLLASKHEYAKMS
ncbi:MAG: hypothetical protein P8074_25590, partial [Anaerolineales bacterium]